MKLENFPKPFSTPSSASIKKSANMRLAVGLLGASLALTLGAGCSKQPMSNHQESSAPVVSETDGTKVTASPASQTSAGQVSCNYLVSGEPAKPVDPPPNGSVSDLRDSEYTIHMNAGDVRIKLKKSVAPCAVQSFESLVSQGFYDSTKCHRLVDTGIFILQCGDPTGTGKGGPGYTFADELPKTSGSQVIYPRGTIAMANAGADTNGSQFFFVWADSQLAPAYTVIGQVTDEDSMNVIGSIASEGVAAEDKTSPIADAGIKNITAS